MEIHVGMGEIRVAKPPHLLTAVGLGSCMAVALYDKEVKIGGLAHIVLPYMKEAKSKSFSTRFSDAAISRMIEEMRKEGANQRNIKAKIFGGANMFPEIIYPNSIMDVGKRNILAVKEELKNHNIEIIAEEVNQDFGRSIFFDTRDGSVLVKTAHLEQRKY